MRKPKWYDSIFGYKVREAYDRGELTWWNIEEWETEQNGGHKPHPELGTRGILAYYVKEGRR